MAENRHFFLKGLEKKKGSKYGQKPLFSFPIWNTYYSFDSKNEIRKTFDWNTQKTIAKLLFMYLFRSPFPQLNPKFRSLQDMQRKYASKDGSHDPKKWAVDLGILILNLNSYTWPIKTQKNLCYLLTHINYKKPPKPKWFAHSVS